MARDFTALMKQLKDGQIDKFTIGPDDFSDFQRAFMAFDTRKRVIGQAQKNGQIIYRYDHDTGENGQ